MGAPIDRLSTLDHFMLEASARWPQHIGALAILDGTSLLEPSGRLRIETVLETIGSRLHLVPRLRQVVHIPRRGLGGPLWVDARHFNLSQHVRVRQLVPGSGEAELLQAVERLRRGPMDPSRPLWELWFLTGLPEGRVGLFVKLHHAIVDGMAAMMTVTALLDTVPHPTPMHVPTWIPAPPPSAQELVKDNIRCRARRVAGAVSVLASPRTTLRKLRLAWPAMRELFMERPASKTSLDRMVGPDRELALIRTHLDAVKGVAHAHGATVNDVLLAVTAGGLDRLLRSRGEPVEATTVRIYVPVSLRRGGPEPQQGNRVAQMAVPLALGQMPAADRLRRIAAQTAMRKARTRTGLGTLFRSRIARRLMLVAVARQRVNATSASIPGPTAELYLAGARVLDVFAVLPLIANEPLGVGALSYAGSFTISVVADRAAVPDLDVLAAGMNDELHALGVLTLPSGLSGFDVRSAPAPLALRFGLSCAEPP